MAKITRPGDTLADDLAAFKRDRLQVEHRRESDVRKGCTFLARLFADLRVERRSEIEPDAVRNWIGDQQWSAKTTKNRVSQLSAFWDWMIDTGRVPAPNPFGTITRRIARESPGEGVRALTIDEVRQLIAAARARAKVARGGRRADAVLFYAVATVTGLRYGELQQIRWRDLRLDDTLPHLVVPAEIAKARRAEPVALTDELAAELRARLSMMLEAGLAADFIFTVSPTHHTLTADARACGLTGRIGWHSFRKACATYMQERGGYGMDQGEELAADQCRHATPGLTKKSYIDPMSRCARVYRAIRGLILLAATGTALTGCDRAGNLRPDTASRTVMDQTTNSQQPVTPWGDATALDRFEPFEWIAVEPFGFSVRGMPRPGCSPLDPVSNSIPGQASAPSAACSAPEAMVWLDGHACRPDGSTRATPDSERQEATRAAAMNGAGGNRPTGYSPSFPPSVTVGDGSGPAQGGLLAGRQSGAIDEMALAAADALEAAARVLRAVAGVRGDGECSRQ